MTKRIILGCFLVGLIGCGGHYAGKLIVQESSIKHRQVGCDFNITTEKPQQSYEELVKLDFVGAKPFRGEEDVRKSIKHQVCAFGGDAVIAEKDQDGGYIRLTVIRWKPQPATTSISAPATQ